MPNKLFFLLLGTLLMSLSLNASATEKKNILFLGDSLTAGYGLAPEQAYPALIAKKINNAQLLYQVVPAGVSGDTTAGGLSRTKWLLRRPVDILVLALGANDGLRGIDPRHTEKNLQSIIDRVRAKYPEVTILIAGMKMPPNLGQQFSADFNAIFPKLAKTNNAAFVPFLLEGVAANPKLNLADGIHPNPEGQKIIAENVWAVLKPLLK